MKKKVGIGLIILGIVDIFFQLNNYGMEGQIYKYEHGLAPDAVLPQGAVSWDIFGISVAFMLIIAGILLIKKSKKTAK